MEPQWGPDPYQRYPFRWWDGAQWTDYVSDGSNSMVDPAGRRQATPAGASWQAGQPAHARRSAPAPRPSVGLAGWKLHALLTFVTCGLWLFAIPAVLLWRNGSRKGAGIWAGAVAVMALLGGITSGGTPSTDTASIQPLAGVGASSSSSSSADPPASTSSSTTTAPPATTKASASSTAAKPAPKSTTKTTTRSTTKSKTSTTRPRTTTTTKRKTSSSPAVVQGVHPGAFCSQHGAYGRTSTGKLMQCKTSATDDRYRWRAA